MSKTWTHIHFNLLEVDNDLLLIIEEDLREQGVTFDTGRLMKPEGPREWHTDWSLEGPMSVKDITTYLDEEGISYTTVEVRKVHEEE